MKRLDKLHAHILKEILIGLFPTPTAYVNFVLMLAFLGVLISSREPLIVLVSALGTIYCLNEWSHRIKEKVRLNGS